MDHTDTQVLDLLVARGIDRHARNARGMTALHQMAGMGNAGIVEDLLRHGLLVNAQNHNGRTALYWAALNVDVARGLIDAGADPLLTAQDGINPLALAHHHGQAAMIALLEHRLLHDMTEATPLSDRLLNRPRL